MDLFIPLIGESILFSPSNEKWSKRRKILSSAFYKDKVIFMVEQVKNVLIDKVQYWEETFVKKDQAFDIFSELQNLAASIIFTCTYGDDVSNLKVDYYENGKKI